MTEITTPTPLVTRDRYGRPLITPPGGNKPIPYTRATTIAGTLEDRYNLELWKMRQVATGLATRPDLIALAAAKHDDKAAINRICGDAMDAAGSNTAANLGTAVHGFIEQINQGNEPVGVPEAIQADLEAYRAAMAGWDVLHAEVFLVLDDEKVAGTADMIMRERDTGRVLIGDLKTGKGAVTYGQGSIAIQLAIYSRGTIYHVDTDSREPVAVDQNKAVVIHLPAGEGRCTLFEVDIAAGWEAAQQAVWTRNWRKHRNLFTPYTAAVIQPEPAAAPAPQPAPGGAEETVMDYLAEIAAAPTVDELEAIYRAAVIQGVDTGELVPACAARKHALAA